MGVGLSLAAALAGAPALAQEPSVVLRSIDNLEKRVVKVEAELGRLRKSPPTVTSAPALDGGSDSRLAALTGRLDSLLARVKSLEVRATPSTQTAAVTDPSALPSPVPEAAASTSIGREPSPASPVQGEIADLIREVKILTAQLKGGAATPSATALPAGAEKPAGSLSPGRGAKSSDKTAAKPAAKTALELKGDIQIQGERKLTAQSKRDNLDDFWGRLNFGAEYSGEDFQSKINIRVFPEGFGFEPLTGATFDTSGQGSLKLQTQSQSRVVVNHAWVKYALGEYRLKVGRFETVETQSENFGNYIDLGPSGKFMSRPAAHNAVEFSRASGPASASALLGTGDRKLNRGFLRLHGRYSPSKKVQASFGWRANLFDRVRFEDEEILQRFDAGLACALPLGWKAFTEAALLQAAGREDDTPVLVGIQPPAGKVLDLLAFEVEWMPTRQVAKKDKDILFNAHARKVLGRFKLDLGLWSDLSDPDNDAFGAGLRMTSGLK